MVYCGTLGGFIYLIHANNGSLLCRKSSREHQPFISSPTLNPQGTYVYIGDAAGMLYLLNVRNCTDMLPHYFVELGNAVTTPMVFSSDGQKSYGTSYDCYFSLHGFPPVGNPYWVKSYHNHGGIESSFALSPCEQRLFLGLNNHNVISLNASNGALLWQFTTGDMVS